MNHDADHARRVAILHAVAAKADELLYADDSMPDLTDREHRARLREGVADVVLARRCGRDYDLVDDALVDLAAGVLLWLEARERERAAA